LGNNTQVLMQRENRAQHSYSSFLKLMAQSRAHTKIPGKASAGGLEVGTAGHFPAQDLYELDAGDLEIRAGGSAAGLIAPFVVG